MIRKNTVFYNIDEFENYKSELGISLRKYGNQKMIQIISDIDLGCTSPYSSSLSYVQFKLKNGVIVTFHHKGDIDCGDFDLLGQFTENDIIKLKKSPIETIRLSGTEFYHDFKNIFFKDLFIKKLNCIK